MRKGLGTQMPLMVGKCKVVRKFAWEPCKPSSLALPPKPCHASLYSSLALEMSEGLLPAEDKVRGGWAQTLRTR